MKRIIHLLLAVVLVVPLLCVSGNGAGSVTKITLSAESYYGAESTRVYTDARQIEQLLSYLPTKADQFRNTDPPMGGRWAVLDYEQDGKAHRWSFCGDLANHFYNGKAYWYHSKDEVWELLLALTGHRNERLYDPLTLKGEAVKSVYIVDGVSRSASGNRLDTDEKAALIAALEKLPEPVGDSSGQMGFLVFTEKGRRSYYFGKSDKGAVAELAAAVLKNPYRKLYSWGAQWLCQIEPEKIASLTYESSGGSDLTLRPSSFASGQVSLTTQDAAVIAEVISFLKELRVEEKPASYSGKPNPATGGGLTAMDIRFRNGTMLSLTSYGNELSIYSSALNRTVTYQLSVERLAVLRDFMVIQQQAIVA